MLTHIECEDCDDHPMCVECAKNCDQIECRGCGKDTPAPWFLYECDDCCRKLCVPCTNKPSSLCVYCKVNYMYYVMEKTSASFKNIFA